MLLAIDSGNTNIVFAVFGAGGDVVCQFRAETRAAQGADELGAWLVEHLKDAGIERAAIADAIIATVVPANLGTLRELCRALFSCEALVVGDDGVDLGIEVLLDTPAEVGADRLVNAVAARDKYDCPLICIDFGTATTFDVINGEGNYAGGAIAPGINLSLDALHAAAAKLPRIEAQRPARVIGTSTVSAMQSGIYWGYVSLIEGLVARIIDEYGAPMKVIATGGLATMFSAATDVIEATDQDLTLTGLYAISQRNRSS